MWSSFIKVVFHFYLIPSFIQHHAASYNIIQHHRTSYNIIQNHTASYNIIQHHTSSGFQLNGTVHTLYELSKITVKHTHFSLLGQSVLCMGCQKITVKQTQISLLGQSILCMGCQESQSNTHISAYWDSPYFVWAVKKSQTNKDISA